MKDETLEQQKTEKQSFLEKHKRSVIVLSLLTIVVSFIAPFIILPLRAGVNYHKLSDTVIRRAAADNLYITINHLKDKDLVEFTEFSLRNEKISDIRLLRKFTNLQTLDLRNISIIKPDIPKWVTLLAKLHIASPSQRSSIDLKPLRKLHNLVILRLSSKSFEDIRPVSKLANLRVLDLSNSNVSDLEPLRNMINLKELDLSHTRVTNLEPIKGLVNLNVLNLRVTQITNLEPLKGLVNLHDLVIMDCGNIKKEQVEDLKSALPNLSRVSSLYSR